MCALEIIFQMFNSQKSNFTENRVTLQFSGIKNMIYHFNSPWLFLSISHLKALKCS